MPPEIIDVDALPEWNNPRRHSRSFRQFCDQTTIDLTNAGDSESDSDISILSKPARPKASSNGKTKEANIPLPAIEKIRVCHFWINIFIQLLSLLLTETQPTYCKPI